MRDRRRLHEESNAARKAEEENDRGRLAPVAARIVMKILYGARF